MLEMMTLMIPVLVIGTASLVYGFAATRGRNVMFFTPLSSSIDNVPTYSRMMFFRG